MILPFMLLVLLFKVVYNPFSEVALIIKRLGFQKVD
jgi:general stress protein CsbA